MVERFLIPTTAPEPALGVVSPHAGYMYSGRTAGAVFSHVKISDVVLILAPNHTGRGRAHGGVSIISKGKFITPLGEVEIEERLAEGLMAGCALVREDPSAHEDEHSIEVQLPFLQVLKRKVKIVPLVVNFDDYPSARTVGDAIAVLLRDEKQEVLMVASSDMTHYQPRSVASKLDRLAIERVEQLDPEGLLKVTREEGITMCGRAPVATLLVAARGLGATQVSLVDYSDSGDVSGDTSYVVGYAGIVIR
jgi:AmmeMemoRadiSam system protein B